MARIQKYIAMFDARERARLKPFTAKREPRHIAISERPRRTESGPRPEARYIVARSCYDVLNASSCRNCPLRGPHRLRSSTAPPILA